MILKFRFLLILACKIPGIFPYVINPVLRKRIPTKGQSIKTKLFGCIFILNLNDYTQRKAWLGAFETKEIKFLQKWLRPGDTALDVGANVGLLTIPMARAIGENGQVFAFEPIDENLLSLKFNLEANEFRNVVLANCAVGNFDGIIRLTDDHHSRDDSGGFYHRASDFEPGIDVKQVRLDHFFENVLPSDCEIRLIKIDVEGMELEVLDGLGNLLNRKKISAFMFEIFVTSQGVAESSNYAIKRISEAGYNIRLISKSGKLKKKTCDVKKLRARRPTAINLVGVSDTVF